MQNPPPPLTYYKLINPFLLSQPPHFLFYSFRLVVIEDTNNIAASIVVCSQFKNFANFFGTVKTLVKMLPRCLSNVEGVKYNFCKSAENTALSSTDLKLQRAEFLRAN